MMGIYRYVRWHYFEAYLSQGWELAATLGPTHGFWSCLMRAPL